jgi:hypothetical protein
MISKILFTIAIIAGVVLLVRFRNRVPPRQAPAPAVPDETAQGFRWLALFAVALILAGSAFFIWQTWRDASEVLVLRVIDTRSGQVTEYRAYRSDVEDRVFRTLDGRRISLAETERLEVRD